MAPVVGGARDDDTGSVNFARFARAAVDAVVADQRIGKDEDLAGV